MSTATAIPAQTTPGSGENRQADVLLTPGEVAALFRVDPKTVTRWAKTGRIRCIRTLGGHRRYPAGQFTTALTPTTQTPATQATAGQDTPDAVDGPRTLG
jgi:excisionase family DNA binding protein